MILTRHQQGFAAVEAILIIIVLGIIGFTGWFVYHSKQATDKSLSNTADSSTTFPKKQNTNQTPSPNATTQKYLEIKEWGVKIPVSDDLSGLVYTYQTLDDGSHDIGFTLNSLQGKGECGGTSALGIMYRFTATDKDDLAGGTMLQNHPEAVHIGQYYYAPSLPQGACSEDQTIQNKISNARLPITKAIEAVRPL